MLNSSMCRKETVRHLLSNMTDSLSPFVCVRALPFISITVVPTVCFVFSYNEPWALGEAPAELCSMLKGFLWDSVTLPRSGEASRFLLFMALSPFVEKAGIKQADLPRLTPTAASVCFVYVYVRVCVCGAFRTRRGTLKSRCTSSATHTCCSPSACLNNSSPRRLHVNLEVT